MSVPHQGVFHRSKTVRASGNFDTKLRMAGDYDLLLREVLERNPYFMQDLVVAGIQYGGISSDPGKCTSTPERVSHGAKEERY